MMRALTARPQTGGFNITRPTGSEFDADRPQRAIDRCVDEGGVLDWTLRRHLLGHHGRTSIWTLVAMVTKRAAAGAERANR